MLLPIPYLIWQGLSIGFVMGLPHTKQGLTSSWWLWSFFFSKMVHLIACKKMFDALNVAKLFFREVIRLHGLPRSITSNRDVKFLSYFWRKLWKQLKDEIRLIFAYHLQKDDQTKVFNCTLGNMLHCLASEHPKKWDECLPKLNTHSTPWLTGQPTTHLLV